MEKKEELAKGENGKEQDKKEKDREGKISKDERNGKEEDKSDKKLLVIDTDGGLDDAQAIMLALGMSEEVEVLAITCVTGNAPVAQVATNVLRVLEVCGQRKVPVYRGCTHSILGTTSNSSFYHGCDGLGDVTWDHEPDESQMRAEHAVTTLTSLAASKPGQITLVALGPLTNLAMACRLDPLFSSTLKECFIMGGNYRGVGNITCCAEFNFHADPEAAHIVLKELQCPVTLITWELCVDHPVDMTWYTREYLGVDSKRSRFIQYIDEHGVRCAERENFDYVWCDQLAVMAAVDKRVVEGVERRGCRVELCGGESRGQCVVQWPSHQVKDGDDVKPISIITKVNMERCYKMMVKSV